MSKRFFRSALTLLIVFSLAFLAGCAMPDLMQPRPKAPPKPKVRTTTVALVVPAAKSSSVAVLEAGARLAAQEQSPTSPVILQVVKQEGNWLNTLASLPKDAVIGGILTDSAYNQMKNAGIMQKKVVFAFKAELVAGDEGRVAWRFYPSMEDQIDAVVKLSVDQLGLRSMASFGPGDRFATIATNQLEQKLATKNVILQRIDASGDPSSWPLLLKPYVNPTTDEVTGALIPATPFEAVFIPDSWRRLSSVYAALASNGEERLVLLGTMLWDGYNTRGTQNASQYALVAYPSAFVRSRAPKSLANSQAASFWGALGYDFVRFASRLHLSGRPASATVTAAAKEAALMNFVMAPISYDNNGRATQKLFMVQPGVAGSEPVNPSTFKAAMAAARQRVEERLAHGVELDALPADQEQGAAAQPRTSSSAHVIRTTPNPSYKLSLPGTR